MPNKNTALLNLAYSFLLIIIFASAGLAAPQWDPNLRPVRLVSRGANEVVLDDFRCD
ncbi:MAG TPA: hypothetical protein PLR50_01270 [Candidatus Rifleibacterium sp.]|nr:hypothetical protein [Candidatus Rifleibacterium sp.]